MKRTFSTLLAITLVSFTFSCEEVNVIDDFPATDRTYAHPISGCVPGGGNQEQNCEDWVEFIGGNQANLLIGGNDIVFARKYRVNDNEITVYDESGLSSLSDLVFKYISYDSLLRLDDNTFWVLKPNP